MDVDAIVDDMIMERIEKEERETLWILIVDHPNYKRYVSSTRPEFFKEVLYDDEGKEISSSTWKFYSKDENEQKIGGLLNDKFRNFIV